MAELLFDRYTVDQMMDITGLSRSGIYKRIHGGRYTVARERGGRGWFILVPRGQDPRLDEKTIGTYTEE